MSAPILEQIHPERELSQLAALRQTWALRKPTRLHATLASRRRLGLTRELIARNLAPGRCRNSQPGRLRYTNVEIRA